MVRNPPTNSGDAGSISGSGRSLGEGNGNPLQYSCLENSMDKEAWWAAEPQNWGSQRVGTWLRAHTHTHTHTDLKGNFISDARFPAEWLLKSQRIRMLRKGFPGGSVVKNLPADAGDTGSIPGLGRPYMPQSN